MDNRLKEAFDQVQAGRELETRTMTLVVQQMRRRQKGGYRRLALAGACGLCLLCLLAGVRWFYFTPTAQISIDINPSLELGVNRLDKVVYVKSYNEDGQELAEELDLNFQSYTEALGQIVSSAAVEELLSEDGVMTIGVWGGSEEQSYRLLAGVSSCTESQGNTYCYLLSQEEVEAAREAGLSCGKYRAFTAIQALDPTITPEEIQGMTMAQIRDLMETLSGGEGSLWESPGRGQHHGDGNGEGQGYGPGRKEGQGKGGLGANAAGEMP